MEPQWIQGCLEMYPTKFNFTEWNLIEFNVILKWTPLNSMTLKGFSVDSTLCWLESHWSILLCYWMVCHFWVGWIEWNNHLFHWIHLLLNNMEFNEAATINPSLPPSTYISTILSVCPLCKTYERVCFICYGF